MRTQKIKRQESSNLHTQVVGSQQLSNVDVDSSLNATSESSLVQTIIEVLVQKGMPRSIFSKEEIQKIARLHGAGATVSQFIDGHDISKRCSKSNRVCLNKLIEVVDSLVIQTVANT